jgi:hypothetical protein
LRESALSKCGDLTKHERTLVIRRLFKFKSLLLLNAEFTYSWFIVFFFCLFCVAKTPLVVSYFAKETKIRSFSAAKRTLDDKDYKQSALSRNLTTQSSPRSAKKFH